LVKYDSDIQRTKVETLARHIHTLRTSRHASKGRIKTLIKWLMDHYADDFTPRMHKAADIKFKFGRFEEAMRRSRIDSDECLSVEERNEKYGKDYLNHRYDEDE